MKAPWWMAHHLAEATDAQLERWAEGYGDSRNLPMLEAVRAEQGRRQERKAA